MQHQLIRHGQGSRTWSIVLNAGEEVNACLQDFARREVLNPTRFTATGWLQDAVLSQPETGQTHQHRQPLSEPTHVVSLVGDVDLHHGKPQIHMRAVLGDKDGGTFDGHLLEAHVDSMLQIIMTEAPVRLNKDYDADAGLALFHSREEIS